ncbi:Transcriptional regulator, ArsR family [uncultured Candidatus Thioglobus sp.]|nr:Transcriptional regulator, ArsR family [uncultured Candidatus Thioglobus sp.]
MMNDMTLLEKDEDIIKATKALKAMAHPLRLKILCALKNNEMPVLEIVKQVGSSQSNISQHIDILRSKEIIESRRDGNRILCKVKDAKILKLVANMQAVFCSESV